MAKRVIVSRQESELTDENAKQFILNVFADIDQYFILNSFLGRIQEAGLVESKIGELGGLVNQLLNEGKLRIEYDYIGGPMGCLGNVWIIKKVAR